MGKKRRRDEDMEELLRTDENFRRLYDKVVALNGGRVPTSEEIDRRLEETIARYRAAS
jgi:branched-subunit amino acid aminotransferase/4-amino-4-deoxychorismate lyase